MLLTPHILAQVLWYETRYSNSRRLDSIILHLRGWWRRQITLEWDRSTTNPHLLGTETIWDLQTHDDYDKVLAQLTEWFSPEVVKAREKEAFDRWDMHNDRGRC